MDESEQQVRITVPKNIFLDSPKLNGELDEQAVKEHYGMATSTPPGTEGYGETESGDPSRSSEEQAHRDGMTSASEERAQIRKGNEDSGLPQESPALLGDRLAGVEEHER